MAKQIIKGAFLGGLVSFIWVMISWGILPWHKHTFNQFHHEEFVSWVLKENTTKSGMYVYPYMGSDDKTADQSHNHKEPLILASVNLDGMDPANPRLYIVSFLTQFVAAGLISILLLMIRKTRYFSKVCFVTIMGLFAAIVSNIPLWNWWGFSSCYVILGMLDLLIGWFLAGLVLAAVVKRKVISE